MFFKKIIPPFVCCLLKLIKISVKYIINFNLIYKNKINHGSMCDKETVYVIGNGPSLNNFCLESIYDSDVITMNYFYAHPELNKLKIVAHCIGEPYGCSSWVDPTNMVKNTPAKTYWFNLSAAKFCKNKFSKYNIFYYPPAFEVDCSLFASANLILPSIQYQSTSQMAIMVAIHMGYKNIYLLGFDHDWLTTKKGFSPHFYNEDSESDEIKRADFSAFSYLDMINISKNLFEIYARIKKIAIKNNIKIVNLSNPSYLDIFPNSHV
ncbi:MAG: hypothetical protein RLZZ298_575 [Pseudomonadota bacterium]|jgi:hypothetical protein